MKIVSLRLEASEMSALSMCNNPPLRERENIYQLYIRTKSTNELKADAKFVSNCTNVNSIKIM